MVDNLKPTLYKMCKSLKKETFPNNSNFTYDEWVTNIFMNEELSGSTNYHTDKYYLHSYMPVYDKLFENYRNNDINILEIGIQQGGSAYLWSKYFTKGSIFGVDIEDSPKWLKDVSGVTTFKENAYSKEGLNLFNDNMFDILIDDGPHTLNSMKYVAKNYMCKMKRNGMLIIEDIPEYEWIEEILNEIPKDIDYKYEIHDLREKKNRFDDIMLVIFITHTPLSRAYKSFVKQMTTNLNYILS